MIDRLKFATELANELNKTNSQYLTTIMVETAVAAAVGGIVCARDNRLADVVNSESGVQYSVKSYIDRSIPEIMEGVLEEREDTGYIVERRISGVRNPDGSPDDVFNDIILDLQNNEKQNFTKYGTSSTKVTLVGHAQDDEFWYFRVTDADYTFEKPALMVGKNFTSRSKNYMLFTGNISSYLGYNEDGKEVYKWIHPNSSTYTRCLMKKYDLASADSFFFKIKKSHYSRPDINTLMSMVVVN